MGQGSMVLTFKEPGSRKPSKNSTYTEQFQQHLERLQFLHQTQTPEPRFGVGSMPVLEETPLLKGFL